MYRDCEGSRVKKKSHDGDQRIELSTGITNVKSGERQVARSCQLAASIEEEEKEEESRTLSLL